MTITPISDIARVHAAERPDAPAIEYEGRTLSFAELNDRANRAANALRDLGVGAGDRVAFLDKNTPEYFETLFGAARLKAVTVPLNWRLAPAEIAQILQDAEPKVLVVGPDFVPVVDKLESELGVGPTIVVIGGHPRWRGYEDELARASAADPGGTSDGDDIVMQLYTSGTTGVPKGVMVTSDNLLGVLEIADSWRLTSDSVNLAVMPMFHVSGSGWALGGLYQGSRTVVLRDIDPARIIATIAEFGVTNALFVPAVIQLLLLTPGVRDANFSTLRAIVYGASPVTDAVLIDALDVFGCEFVQVYGLTETSGAIAQLEHRDHDPVNRPELLRSCGQPYPWVEIRITDPDTGEEASVGEVGELWTRSRQNMRGYYGNEEATRAAVTEDGWLKTGDAGYLDADGYLFLYDRVKDMIVSGGENVYPADVENVLAAHADVVDVAVIGVPDERWGEAVKAVVVRRDGSELDAADLIEFARGRLAGYKLPKSVDFVDALPRNASGKVLKREIREPYWRGRSRRIG